MDKLTLKNFNTELELYGKLLIGRVIWHRTRKILFIGTLFDWIEDKIFRN